MAGTRPNLILGVIENYHFEQLEPFLLSLRQTGYAGEVVLFHHGIDRRSLGSIQAFGARLLPFHNLRSRWQGRWRKRVDRVSRRFHQLKWPLYETTWRFLVGTVRLRHFLYQRFLQHEGGNYGRVLLADTRDLVFQADPFVDAPNEDLVFFAETFPIGQGKLNAEWISTQLGPATLDRLCAKIALCAGTTMGRPEALLFYCDRMIETMQKAANQHLIHGDQGLHNAVVYEGLEGISHSTRICQNGEHVYTLTHHFDTTALRWNASGQIVDRGGDVVPILHQYDRHPNLAARLLRRIHDFPKDSESTPS